MTTTIRDATMDDVPALLQLANSVSLSHHTKQGDNLDQTGFLVSDFTAEHYQDFLRTAQHFLVLLVDDAIAAFLLAYGSESVTDSQELNTHIKVDLCTSPFVLIKQIVVSPQHRRKGLAEQLYLKLYERLPVYYDKESSPRTIYTAIVAEPNNPVSIAFHEKLGFAEVDQFTPKQDPKRRYIFCNPEVQATLAKFAKEQS